MRKRNCATCHIIRDMKKKTAINRAGSVWALATLLKITHQAIYAWGDDVPPAQELALRKRRPEWFKLLRHFG